MHYRTLGRTGIKVSPYALGAMMFGSVGTADQNECARMIHAALDAGINLIDTSDAYSSGESEEIVGRAIAGCRESVVLATKFGLPMGADPNQQGASRRWIMAAVEGSLRRLGTDHIDLYQLHRPDPATDIGETLSALDDLVHQGKIRSYGTSKLPASDIVEAQWTAQRSGLVAPHVEQPTYSILNRGIEREILPVAQRHGLGVLVWSPLAQGLLTGRARRGQQTDLRRAASFKHMNDERRLDAVEEIIPIADEAGVKLTHLAVAFAIAHPGVTSAIIGPRTLQQLDDLIAGIDVELSDDLLDRIDQIVPPGTDVGQLDMAYNPPALLDADLRRRSLATRSATGPDEMERGRSAG